MTPAKRAMLFKAAGLLLCTVPAAVTALFQFPLWIRHDDSTLSLLSVLVLCLCAIPFRRVLSECLRSPSAWQMWLVLWLALTLLEPLFSGLRIVALIALPFSVLGAVCFRIARGIAAGERSGRGQGEREGGADE